MVPKFLQPAVGVFILNLLALATATAQDPTERTFMRTAAMASPRERHTGTLLDNGKVLIAGGNTDTTPNSTNMAELFDPKALPSPIFTSLPQMTSARSDHTATLLLGGKVLIAGGISTAGAVTNTAELFDPTFGTSGIFTPVAPMNDRRSAHTATLLPDGKVLIAGGDTGSLPTDTGKMNSLPNPHYFHRPTGNSEIFDPTTGVFTATNAPMNVARAGHTATLVVGADGKKRVLIAGGVNDGSASVTNTAELFDPESGTFTSPIPMIVGRAEHTATLLPNGKVLITGGISAAGVTNTAELFDPTLGTSGIFTPVLSIMNEFRSDHSATLLPDGTVLIAGGINQNGKITDTAELFNPLLGLFLPLLPKPPSLEIPRMTEPRYFHRPTLVVDSAGVTKILITGGITLDGVTKTAELFNPLQKAAEAPTDWPIVNSPNITSSSQNNYLDDVACASASDCWAVGGNVRAHWDGTSWTIDNPNIASSAQDNPYGNDLYGVTCAPASSCWAVGAYYNGTAVQTVIERWDGTAWAIVTSPNTSTTQDNRLSDVTCVSASDCWAVGYHNTGSGFYQTLIERWDGTSWSIVTSPNTSSTQDNFLSDVTCTSASDCWAVGYYSNGTLTEHWNGSSWTIVFSPNPGTTANSLSGVTCASATDCWAVGYYTTVVPSINGINGTDVQNLIEHWDGALWTVVLSPNGGNVTASDVDKSRGIINYLSGVTCASGSDCWAVGSYHGFYKDDPKTGSYNRSFSNTVIEHWDGISWAIVGPTYSSSHNNLSGVTCVSASDCWAVGSSETVTKIAHWTGTSWRDSSCTNTFTRNNNLYGVTCTSESDCWAVGSYETNTKFQTLVERWDGTSWTIVTSPSTSNSLYNVLRDVTCVSASDCWAVGYYYTGSRDYYTGYYQTLIEHWDGTSWSIVTSPNSSATQDNYLLDMTCVSASQCWAVGYYYVGGTPQTLIERWDGGSWAIVSSPDSYNNYLSGVTCVSAVDCWAVGSIFQHWDGTSWTSVTAPSNAKSVSCTSASNCWAVGYSDDGSYDPIYQTAIEHWDGTSWAIVTSPNTSTTVPNLLSGVTCVSASNCWAVGYYLNDTNGVHYQTLIERWDGTSWSIVTSPNTSVFGDPQDNYLNAMTCASASDCWAVGSHSDRYYYVNQTLTEHYTPPAPTNVVSRKTQGAGTFDVDLPLAGNPGIECRSGGTNNDYQMVMTFANAVSFNSAAVTSGTGTVSSTSGSGTTALTVNLTGVTNAQTITLTLSGVNDGTKTGYIGIRMGVLLGDTNANKTVSNGDVSSVQGQVGATVTQSNFRNDVNANGTISNGDVAAAQAQVGAQLPP